MFKAIKGFLRGVAVDLTNEKIVRAAEDWTSIQAEKAVEMSKEFKRGYEEGKLQAQAKVFGQDMAKNVAVLVDVATEVSKQVKAEVAKQAPKIVEMVKESKSTVVTDSNSKSEEKK